MNMGTQLPRTWREVSLREVCKPTEQWSPEREQRDEFGYVDVSAVSRESSTTRGAQRVKATEAPRRARKIRNDGYAIFATVRPTLRRVAFVAKDFDQKIAWTAF